MIRQDEVFFQLQAGDGARSRRPPATAPASASADAAARHVPRQPARPARPRRLAQSSRDRRKAGRCVLEGEHLVARLPATASAPPEYADRRRLGARRSAHRRAGARRAAGARRPGAADAVRRDCRAAGRRRRARGDRDAARRRRRRPRGSRCCSRICRIPGNVGTILRTAAAAGVEQVLLSKHCAFAWSPKVLRAGAGRAFPDDGRRRRRPGGVGRRSFAAAGGRVVALDASRRRTAIRRAAGDAAGARRRQRRRGPVAMRCSLCADARVTIPMPGGMESLNAAAAAAVALFECVRRALQENR